MKLPRGMIKSARLVTEYNIMIIGVPNIILSRHSVKML